MLRSCTKIKVLLIGTIFLGISSNLLAENRKDILGLEVGDDFTSVERYIKLNYPDLNRMQIKNHLNQPQGFTYMKDPLKSRDFQITVLPDSTGKVWYIGQARHMEGSNRMNYETVLQSLIEKYGPPSNEPMQKIPVKKGIVWRPQISIIWSFDSDGVIINHSKSGGLFKDPCILDNNGDDFSRTSGANIFIPRTTTSKCKFSIKANIRVDYYTSLVTAYAVFMYDAQQLFNDPILGESSRVLAIKRNENDPKNYNRSKPKL